MPSPSSLATDTHVLIELGRFEDLMALVELLNESFESHQYRLEKVENRRNYFLFVEDQLSEDEYDCGLVIKQGEKAYAFSEAVYDMIMVAYQRYQARDER
jgi:hypothetical protein